MTEPEHPISQAVRDARRELGVSQAELADRLDIDQPHVSAWETSRVPTIDQVAEIEAALKLPAGAVFRLAGFVIDHDSMTLEQRVKIDQTIASHTRQTILSVIEADRLQAGA